jgi:hypothetical protein
LQHPCIPSVSPKIKCITFMSFASSHHKKMVRQGHDIPPPERPNMFSVMGRDRSGVECFPG